MVSLQFPSLPSSSSGYAGAEDEANLTGTMTAIVLCPNPQGAEPISTSAMIKMSPILTWVNMEGVRSKLQTQMQPKWVWVLLQQAQTPAAHRPSPALLCNTLSQVLPTAGTLPNASYAQARASIPK